MSYALPADTDDSGAARPAVRFDAVVTALTPDAPVGPTTPEPCSLLLLAAGLTGLAAPRAWRGLRARRGSPADS